MSISLKNN